jgi:carbon monoxide dehydrogenase subunit G
MKVRLERTFPLAAGSDAAWTLLQDIEGVAGCMPGAKITERIDDRHFKGTIAVKFGPANLTFRGQVEVVELDLAARVLRLVGKGTDTTGGSGATLDLTARVEAESPESCRLLGTSEVALSGKAAAFGARVAEPVADQVMKQFIANFAARLPPPPPPPGAAPEPGAAAAAPAPAPATAPAQEAKPLNALALIWAVIRDWLRSLFGARRT